jgi:hypothetical protein
MVAGVMSQHVTHYKQQQATSTPNRCTHSDYVRWPDDKQTKHQAIDRAAWHQAAINAFMPKITLTDLNCPPPAQAIIKGRITVVHMCKAASSWMPHTQHYQIT